MQGRGDQSQGWVKTVKIAYSINGRTWNYVDKGSIFNANSDRNTKASILFETPVYARTIRIYPQSYNNWPTMRFEAVYLDLS